MATCTECHQQWPCDTAIKHRRQADEAMYGPGLLNPDPERPKLVILGKSNPRKDELPALIEFGRWMAHLERKWETTKTPGVPQIIREAYLRERDKLGKPSNMSIIAEGAGLPTHKFVLIFSDKRFIDLLDQKYPAWRDFHWYPIHNPKATQDLAKHMRYMCTQAGLALLPDDDG